MIEKRKEMVEKEVLSLERKPLAELREKAQLFDDLGECSIDER
ncbi:MULTISPECIES: hypothetical protein [unclassified Wolbachia]